MHVPFHNPSIYAGEVMVGHLKYSEKLTFTQQLNCIGSGNRLGIMAPLNLTTVSLTSFTSA